MHSYKDITKHFGVALSDVDFQLLIKDMFGDITNYNVAESDYMRSEGNGIELGFINNEAIFDNDESIVITQGNPIFSHINIFPKSTLKRLPFQVNFADSRSHVIGKAGQPFQTKKGEASFLGSRFLLDNYKVEDIVITFDYNPENERINFIQIRDNNLIEHLKLE